MNERKHAYLVIAHDNVKQLQMLIHALDAPFNDIYIHFDQSSNQRVERDNFKVQYSQLTISTEFKVHWGSYSIVKTEMFLFRQAFRGKYSYYHLLSGSDYPIKRPIEIYNFFEDSQKEFVLFSSETMQEINYDRIDYRHICSEKFRTGRNKMENKVIDWLDEIGVLIQKGFGIRQLRLFPVYQKGSQWVSLTGNFVEYLLTQEAIIEKAFRLSFVPDEMFVQTVLVNSPYKENIYDTSHYNKSVQNMRYIDWERGKPYVFTFSDLDELLNSSCMFARKFDTRCDSRILYEIDKRILR